MNALSELFVKRQKELGLSLKDIAKDKVSQQALSNYQRAVVLPAEDMLPMLAGCYDLDIDVVKQAYTEAIRRPRCQPVPAKPFFDILKTTNESDHIITVTQNSIFYKNPELTDILFEILDNGTNFTYVLYTPQESYNENSSRWKGNHYDSARTIRQELTNKGKMLSEQINYLNIKKPTINDFAFLKAFDATVYLYKDKKPLNESYVWDEAEASAQEHWWQPRSYHFLSSLHYWLVNDCGLQLPSTKLKFPDTKKDRGGIIEMKTLDDFLNCSQH